VIEVGTVPMIVETVDPNAATAMNLSSGGVWNVPKDSSTFSAGDAVYWDSNGSPVTGTASSGAATSTASGNNLMGLVTPLGAAATGDSYVQVLLTAAKRTATIAGSVTADDITGSDSSLAISGLSAAQGGDVILSGGTSTASNNNGGALTLRGGAKNGSGADGAIVIGDSNTSSVTLSKMPRIPTAAVAAAGSNQGNAAALSEGFNLVSAADGTKGVILPAAVAGMQVIVKGTAAAVLKVYPNTSDVINALSADAAISLASGAIPAIFIAYDATTWYTIPLVPS
jgi:hypothetical protein